MADPTTELAKEFLEINGFIVRKETKFYKKIKNKKPFGTASDIDIIATRSRPVKINDIELKENIVAEAKNWIVNKKETVDDIYNDKFKRIENFRVSWVQLRNFISSKRFDKVLFCLATTEDVYRYALEKYGIIIITSGFIIKSIADFVKTSERNWSYYPEWYHYNTIRTILLYLYYTKFKDKLTLEDVVWIDPKENRQYANRFVELNAKFLEDFIFYKSYGEPLKNLINRAFEEDPGWFRTEILPNMISRIMSKNRKWLKKQLRSNRSFWNYLIETEE